MAITVTQTIAQVSGSGGPTIVISPASTAAGALIVVCAESATASATISGVTDDKSNTYTQSKTNTANGFQVDQYESHNSIAGVTSITVTFSANVGANTGHASGYEIAGAHLTSPIGASSTGSGSQIATTINLSNTSFTPNATDSIIVANYKISATPTSWSSPGGYTIIGGATRHQSLYKIRTGSGDETAPVDAVFGASGNRSWTGVAVEYLVAAVAATTKNLPLMGAG